MLRHRFDRPTVLSASSSHHPEVAKAATNLVALRFSGRLMSMDINQPYDVAVMGVAEHRKGLA